MRDCSSSRSPDGGFLLQVYEMEAVDSCSSWNKEGLGADFECESFFTSKGGKRKRKVKEAEDYSTGPTHPFSVTTEVGNNLQRTFRIVHAFARDLNRIAAEARRRPANVFRDFFVRVLLLR